MSGAQREGSDDDATGRGKTQVRKASAELFRGTQQRPRPRRGTKRLGLPQAAWFPCVPLVGN